MMRLSWSVSVVRVWRISALMSATSLRSSLVFSSMRTMRSRSSPLVLALPVRIAYKVPAMAMTPNSM